MRPGQVDDVGRQPDFLAEATEQLSSAPYDGILVKWR